MGSLEFTCWWQLASGSGLLIKASMNEYFRSPRASELSREEVLFGDRPVWWESSIAPREQWWKEKLGLDNVLIKPEKWYVGFIPTATPNCSIGCMRSAGCVPSFCQRAFSVWSLSVKTAQVLLSYWSPVQEKILVWNGYAGTLYFLFVHSVNCSHRQIVL